MEQTAFANQYNIIPEFLAVAAILLDIERSHNAAPKSGSAANPEIFRNVAATYYAGRRWKRHVGDGQYGGAVLATAIRIGGP